MKKSTGYELTELARAYYVFQANGFEVDIASPLGGKAPVVLDDDDMATFDYAFLNDPKAQNKTNHTIAIKDIVLEEYQAVFFVGGKGAMFDFPQNTKIQTIVREYFQTGKVIGAVCHGPAALVNVTLDNGSPLLTNKKVSGFTNEEELFLIPKAKTIFPFLLQEKLTAQGAKFSDGGMYLENVSQDGNLVTGQNPWSVWLLAETMIKQLGYAPKKREITAEENSITLLSVYKNKGYDEAEAMMKNNISEGKPIARELIAMHGVVAAMQIKLGTFFDLISLLVSAKKESQAHESSTHE